MNAPADAAHRPPVLLTRPVHEAGAWLAALLAHGWPAESLPLLAIAPPRDSATLEALATWRRDWLDCDAVMFVSGAAVAHFLSGAIWPAAGEDLRPQLWAPGPGTAQRLASSLQAAGWQGRIQAPAADAGQFDSEALWAVVAAQVRPGWRILWVRGAGDDRAAPSPGAWAGQGRDWLMRQCQQAGAQVEACVAYERGAPAWTPAQQARAQAAQTDGSLWLFSSSQGVAQLARLVPGADWSRARAVATHPRIAAAARAAGFGHVVEARPAPPDVTRALESVSRLP